MRSSHHSLALQSLDSAFHAPARLFLRQDNAGAGKFQRAAPAAAAVQERDAAH